jgi:hypothetical protein
VAVPLHSSLGGNEFVEHYTNHGVLNGEVPVNGWQISNVGAGTIYVSDQNDVSPYVGIPIAPLATYTSPPGYKPIHFVVVWSDHDTYIVVRIW